MGKDTSPSRPLVQVLSVREPLARAISAYYFWGELCIYRKLNPKHRVGSGAAPNRLGSAQGNLSKAIPCTHKFLYHGNELTAPSKQIAAEYAEDLFYVAGNKY